MIVVTTIDKSFGSTETAHTGNMTINRKIYNVTKIELIDNGANVKVTYGTGSEITTPVNSFYIYAEVI